MNSDVTPHDDAPRLRGKREQEIRLMMILGLSQSEMSQRLITAGLMPAHRDHFLDEGERCEKCYANTRRLHHEILEDLTPDEATVLNARHAYKLRCERIFREGIAEFQEKVGEITTITTEDLFDLKGNKIGTRKKTQVKRADRGAIRADFLRLAMDAAVKAARVDGVDTERPLVVKLDEEYTVEVRENGSTYIVEKKPDAPGASAGEEGPAN